MAPRCRSYNNGVATTSADGEAVDVAGLGGDLAAGHVHAASGSHAVAGRARRAATGSSPASNATARPSTVDAPTGTATITLDAGASRDVHRHRHVGRRCRDGVADNRARVGRPSFGRPPHPRSIRTMSLRLGIAGPATPPSGCTRRASAQVRRTEAPLAGATFARYGSEANAINGTSPLATCVTIVLRPVLDGRRSAPGRATSGSARSPRPPGTSGSTRSAREPRTRRATTRRASRTWSGSTSGTTRLYNVPPAQPLSGGGTEARAFANGLNNPAGELRSAG